MTGYDARTSLIVVDVQNDFADPAGSLAVRGGDEVVGVANAEIAEAVAAGATVFYTQDWHPADTPHFEKDGGIWPVHCVQDTWGAQLHPQLDLRGQVVRKGENGEDGYSGFTMKDPVSGDTVPTPLGALLREREVERLVVLGLATDYCVRATALEGRELGWPVVVPWAGVRAVDLQPGDGERAREELRAAGVEIA